MITAKDVDCIYEVPLIFHEEGLDERIVEKLNMWTGAPNLSQVGKGRPDGASNPRDTVRIAMVGKYVDLADSYKSLNEALVHGGIANECQVELDYIDSEKIEQDGLPEACRARRRHARADGLRAARHRGQDRGGALRARGEGAVLRHLLRHADGGDRVRAPRLRPRGRQLERGRRADAASGDRSDGRPARR